MNGKASWLSRLLAREPGEIELPKPKDSPGSHKVADEGDAEYRQYRDRGLRALEAGQIAEALEALGRAVYLRPDRAEAHQNVGRAFERAGKIEAARQAYLHALESDGTSREAQAALAALPPPPPGRKDFEVGQVLRSTETGNTYTVREVKKGGFGAVYIVTGERGTAYALKTFQARYLWSDEDRERFEREALTWVMLDRHPHIVSAAWLERIEGFPCLLLEYVAGGDLAQLLRRGPLPLARVLELAFQFCDGMAYAHNKLGIVHRDVKPSNCLLTEDGTLKVTDFGLARAFGEAQEAGLGLSGLGAEVKSPYTVAAGTPQYMAPEQFQAGAALDTRTDIYAFGIMLYQMLTRDLPLMGSVAQAHIEANASSYQVPQELLRLTLRCVEPERARRPTSFQEVREMLGGIYETLTGKAAPPSAKPLQMRASEYNSKGMALDTLGHSTEALACYERGLKMAPHDSYLWMNKGALLSRLGRLEEALVCIDRGLEIAPKNVELWANKAGVLRHLGRFEESLACSDRGLQIDPHNRDLWINKGGALAALGRSEEALGCFDRGLKVDPHDSDLWLNKGLVLLRLGRLQESLTCFDRALEINPRNSVLWSHKGTVLGRVGRFEEALACCDRALEIDPHDSVLWRNKGAALGGLGRLEEALACFDRALEMAPHDAGLWAVKAMALEDLGRTQEANDCLRRARELGG